MKALKVASDFLKRDAYDFSSVQAQIPETEALRILAWGKSNIPDEILTASGREDDIHVTIKYGIHIKDFTELRNLFVGLKPINATLGKISLFDTDDIFDVVKIDVDSSDLHKMNKLISTSFEVTNTHPVYHPHITLAYVKKGCGDVFNGSEVFVGTKVKLDEIVFSGKDNRKTLFKLPDKKAYFNQSTWLPGRTTRDYPFPQTTKKQRTAIYICPTCSIQREMVVRMKCPKCGHFMRKV